MNQDIDAGQGVPISCAIPRGQLTQAASFSERINWPVLLIGRGLLIFFHLLAEGLEILTSRAWMANACCAGYDGLRVSGDDLACST
jgi:hypothetical protein